MQVGCGYNSRGISMISSANVLTLNSLLVSNLQTWIWYFFLDLKLFSVNSVQTGLKLILDAWEIMKQVLARQV